MPNIALVGHSHTCPTCGHSGTIVEGNSACTVNGIPIASVGSTCQCSCGVPNAVAEGTSALTINGIPVALEGHHTAHGSHIVQGDSAVHVS